MYEQNIVSDNNVHGWLMDVPGYRENYRHVRRLQMVNESDETSLHKERPSSLLSISSEDSINLDELINRNFTTDMDDETDLPDLSALDLDDSNEDFWKMDNFLSDLIIPTQFSGKKGHFNPMSCNRSKYESEDDDYTLDSKNTSYDDLLEETSFYNMKKATEHDFLKDLNLTDHHFDGKPKMLQVPTSLPVSPKSLDSSPIDQQQRINRCGSTSSENSLNSSSTIKQHQHIYPSASTSTSSISSHSTNSSFLPRSSSFKEPKKIIPPSRTLTQSRYRPHTSSSDTTSNNPTLLPSRSISSVGLARRATHIPAPSPPTVKKIITPSPTRTKSTTLVHKKSNSSLIRPTSRIGQPVNRASHIPTPPTRSTTSLGISSIFSSSQKQTKEERPKTSMGASLLKSPIATVNPGLRRAPSTMIPSSSKSTALKPSPSSRLPSSRNMYK